MTVVTVKPVKRNNLDKLFNEFFRNDLPAFRPGVSVKTGFLPATNVIETENDFRIELAVPGLEKSDFTINVEKEILTISAKKERVAAEGEYFLHREFGNVEFSRSWRLPATINTAAIEAHYEAGVLQLVLPKKEEAKEKPARTIKIA